MSEQDLNLKLDKLCMEWEALLQADAILANELPGRIKFIVLGPPDRIFLVRGAPKPGLSREGNSPCDCSVTLNLLTLLAIAEGDLNPQVAFVQGKIKVSGDTSLALRLNSLFERSAKVNYSENR